MTIQYAADSNRIEGRHVAILVLIVDAQERTVTGATVLSPNPAVHGKRYRYGEVARTSSDVSFAAARGELLEYVRLHEPWILPLLAA
jgi:hypothetical protein